MNYVFVSLKAVRLCCMFVGDKVKVDVAYVPMTILKKNDH